MRAKRWPIQLRLAVVATACIACSLAHQHLVGDSIWSIPPSNEFYSNWASNRSFAVGDDLGVEEGVRQLQRRQRLPFISRRSGDGES
ncbi:unnamed protein product [Musa acuminata var. zebrina]